MTYQVQLIVNGELTSIGNLPPEQIDLLIKTVEFLGLDDASKLID